MTRWNATARTWARKAAALLRQQRASATAEERWLVGYDAAWLLEALLDVAQDLVPVLEPDQLADDRLEQLAREVAGALRRGRLAEALEQVDGRSPAETAAFLAKAAKLRGPVAARSPRDGL